MREVNNNMYSVNAYFWSKIMTELPAGIIGPLLYGGIIYFILGFSTEFWYKFPSFIGICILIYQATGSYALFLSTMIPNKNVIVILIPILIIPFMLFAGFFVN